MDRIRERHEGNWNGEKDVAGQDNARRKKPKDTTSERRWQRTDLASACRTTGRQTKVRCRWGNGEMQRVAARVHLLEDIAQPLALFIVDNKWG